MTRTHFDTLPFLIVFRYALLRAKALHSLLLLGRDERRV